MVSQLRKSFHWYAMTSQCHTFVKCCNICQRYKGPNIKKKAPLGSFHAGAPLERVHIDITGPFLLSEDGNLYILMVVDQFTKWVECLPMPNQTS